MERAEGYDARPAWADPNVPFTRKGDEVRVLGFAQIGAEQRLEAGFRATDSYARAELVRFVSTRVVAVLKESMSSEEADTMSEAITEESSALVDDLLITAHYWERVRKGKKEELHLYSRIDVDRQRVADLLQQVYEKKSDLRTPFSQVKAALEANWDALENTQEAHSASDLLPAGVYVPEWAKAGDREDNREFRFVCHGLATQEDQARALAQRMCTEKLCRLFGVQIKARTSVKEDLKGLEVESEVSEGCLDVHIEGRKTEFNGGECGPKGCVQWTLQSYPKSAYLAERERLDNPTVVERQVVVQEGNVRYKDPAECERELETYGRIEDRNYTALKGRLTILKRARAACQGIDARESGLFERLSHLLQEPLGSFVFSGGRHTETFEDNYLYANADWFERLKTARFFDQRIKMVIDLLDDAMLPLLAYDTLKEQPANLEAIQKVMTPLYAYPFNDERAKPSHIESVHAVHGHRSKDLKDPKFLSFLLEESKERTYDCGSWSATNGNRLVQYILRNGQGTAQEWEAMVKVTQSAKSPRVCLQSLLQGQPSAAARESAMRKIMALLEANQLDLSERHEAKSQLQSFLHVLMAGSSDGEDRYRWLNEYVTAMKGAPEERKRVLLSVLGMFDPSGTRSRCGRYFEVGRAMAQRYPEFSLADMDYWKLCNCLGEGGYSGEVRRAVTDLHRQHGKVSCENMTEADWPPEYLAIAQRPKEPLGFKEGTPPRGSKLVNPWDVARFVRPALRECLRGTQVELPYNGVLSTWNVIQGQVSGSRVTYGDTKVLISSSLSRLRRREGVGTPTPEDARKTEDEIASCVQANLSKLTLAQDSPILGQRATKFWVLFSSEDMVSAYYGP